LKPANILITTDGATGRATPKLLDFGIAKLLGPAIAPEDSAPSATRTGLQLMTPEYASPEQIRGEAVTAASDVYSLGVVLYELLTGERPYRLKHSPLTAPHEVARLICEQEPMKPSQAATGFHPVAPSQLRGDLDNITLKALRKESCDRYASVADFSADIERHLAGRPVAARGVSPLYRAAKFIRRHRTPVIAATILLAAAVGAAFYYKRQERGQRRARYAAQIGQAARDWEAGNLKRMRETLGRLAPADGEEDLRGFEWHYLHGLRHSEERRLELREQPARLNFSADGRFIVACFNDGRVTVLEGQSGRESATFRADSRAPRSLAVSPDGRKAVTGGVQGAVKLWDVTTGRLVAEDREPGDPMIYCAEFSPDGGEFVTGSGHPDFRGPGGCEAHVRDAASGKLRLRLAGHTNYVRAARYSRDGRLIVTGAMDRTARLWDARTGRLIRTFAGAEEEILSVALSPDNRLLAAGGTDRQVRVWEAETGALLYATAFPDWVSYVDISSDGQFLAVATDSSSARVFDLRTGRELLHLKGETEFEQLRFSAGQPRLVAGISGHPSYYDLARLLAPSALKACDGCPVRGAIFSRDGNLIAAGYEGFIPPRRPGGAVVWRLLGDQQGAFLGGHEGSVLGLALTPDGNTLATASGDRTVRVWDLAARREALVYRAHTSIVYTVAASPDGTLLASAGDDRVIRLWERATGRDVRVLQGHEDSVWALAFSPDGKLLASAGHNQTLKLWDVRTGELRSTLVGHAGQVVAVAFSPDGRKLASGSWDRTARVWDVAARREVAVLEGHADDVNGVAFSPDGRRLATASADRTIKLWDAENGEELLTLSGHGDRVWSVAFSPDGQTLLSGSWDGTVRLWRAASGR
jgi:eukaryotic-like serine/threonine-protein kinase